MNPSIKRFILISILEGLSFLVLLGIAMPLKYFAGYPMAVTIVGSLHGLFFVLYMIALAFAALKNRWSFGLVFGGLVASVLPFGPFVFDSYLKRKVI